MKERWWWLFPAHWPIWVKLLRSPFDCWDPCLIAEIPILSKIKPLLLLWPSLTALQDSNTTLPFPQTPTDPQDLQHYIIALQDPQTTSNIPNHISAFIILF